MELSGLDIVFIVLLVLAALRAGFRGFVREFMSMAALVAGIAAAVLFSGVVAGMLIEWIPSTTWAQVIAFLGLFVVVYVIVKIFENALNSIVDKIHADNLDKALGFLWGIAEGVALITLLIIVLRVQPLIDTRAVLADSTIVRILAPLLPYAERFIPVPG